ncbi:carbohydrate ABC transporter permease [Kribbella albertanoniae]|uniref:Carbohydrate ABC transporter permease n=1 Tax=Kribbella albertanoniae TaxID=1266829 RepID=A0A4R4QAT1_9ACTN|nr:carbohydrate ABC transporter permease [Kribbella albertanoniae]
MRAASVRLWRASPLTYLALIVGCVTSLFPIYWMFVVATRSNDVINDVPPPLLPGAELAENIGRVFANEHAAFGYGLVNSLVVSSVVTLSVVFFSTLAGFAFAKLRFRGRNAMLLVIVATMMVPVQLGLIPLYMLMVKIGWNGSLQAVIVPFLVSGFGVFMMRQYAAEAISDELVEAARVDGCSTFRIYWNVVLPILRPAAAILGLLTFMQTWNEFIWPYAILDANTPTVQLSLSLLATAYYTDYAQVFAATALATLPLLAVFIVFGRQIIGGIMEGAIKS